jgi:hypothetical protein
MTKPETPAQEVPRKTAGNPPAAPAAAAAAKNADSTNTQGGDTAVLEKPPADPAVQGAVAGGDAPVTMGQLESILGRVMEKATEAATTASMQATDQMIQNLFKRLESRAQNHPASITHGNMAEALDPMRTLEIPVDGNLDDLSRSDLDIAKADPLAFEDHAAELAFMAEPVKILLAETNDPNEQNVVFVSVNGRGVYLQRGIPQIVRRYYVERLYRARPQKIDTSIGRNQNGDPVNRITKKSALQYPFEILQDNNPRGRPWAEKMKREGA